MCCDNLFVQASVLSIHINFSGVWQGASKFPSTFKVLRDRDVCLATQELQEQPILRRNQKCAEIDFLEI